MPAVISSALGTDCWVANIRTPAVSSFFFWACDMCAALSCLRQSQSCIDLTSEGKWTCDVIFEANLGATPLGDFYNSASFAV